MATRRQFTLEYKKRILAEARRCTGRGEVGALLRCEGLYASQLADWRKKERNGSLGDKKRGRKADPDRPQRLKLEKLERENKRLRKKLGGRGERTPQSTPPPLATRSLAW